MNAIALLLMGVMGLVLGALGGGGSILAVPILLYVLEAEPKVAIAMSLPIVALASLVGAWGHWRLGHVDVRRALLFGMVAVAGAYGAARAAAYVDGRVQVLVLGITMIAAAVAMLRSSARRAADPAPAARPHPLIIAAIALAIGALTGLVGVGGGFLFVPALVLVAALPMKQAIGTSLLVIAMSATAGFLGYLDQVTVPWRTVGLLLLPASGGMLAGVFLIRFMSQRALQQAFALVLLGVAAALLVDTARVFS